MEYETIMDFDMEFFDENLRYHSDSSDNFSFFTSMNPPSSPRPCPISPCHDNANLLPMDEDFIDLSSFIDKENKKPFSPARKRLNMDVLATSSSPITKNALRQSNSNLNISSPLRSSGLKRTESSIESPVQSKRHKSENDHIFFQNQHMPAKKPISIMNVLTSSSENLRKNRL